MKQTISLEIAERRRVPAKAKTKEEISLIRSEAGKKGGSSPHRDRKGRPYKDGKERTKLVQVKLTPEEHAILLKSVRAFDSTITDMIRNMLLPVDEITQEINPENTIPILIKNQPTYLTREQAKDLYMQLTKILL